METKTVDSVSLCSLTNQQYQCGADYALFKISTFKCTLNLFCVLPATMRLQ